MHFEADGQFEESRPDRTMSPSVTYHRRPFVLSRGAPPSVLPSGNTLLSLRRERRAPVGQTACTTATNEVVEAKAYAAGTVKPLARDSISGQLC